jgi:hypothetical protein
MKLVTLQNIDYLGLLLQLLQPAPFGQLADLYSMEQGQQLELEGHVVNDTDSSFLVALEVSPLFAILHVVRLARRRCSLLCKTRELSL